jgi:hypothetical protein
LRNVFTAELLDRFPCVLAHFQKMVEGLVGRVNPQVQIEDQDRLADAIDQLVGNSMRPLIVQW